MSEHSPLPWIAAAKFSSVVGVPIVGQMGEAIANTSIPGLPEEWPDHRKRRSEANAAFIVHAVNNHDDMVEALNQIAWMDDFLDADTARRMMAIARDALVGLSADKTPQADVPGA